VGIPNLTIHGLPLERMAVIHSPADRYEAIDTAVYENTYRLALAFLEKLDDLPARSK
jgi:hypothetical protein